MPSVAYVREWYDPGPYELHVIQPQTAYRCTSRAIFPTLFIYTCHLHRFLTSTKINSHICDFPARLLYHFIRFPGHASQRGQKIMFDLVFRTRLQIGVHKFSKFPNPRRIDRNGTVHLKRSSHIVGLCQIWYGRSFESPLWRARRYRK